MEKIIDIKDVFKIYSSGNGTVNALNGINLTIYKGEFIAIVGQSGSGKSTLMNILGCLDSPTKGSYLLDNIDVSTLNDKELSNIRNNKIGFIFQGFNLIPTLTAYENVELPLIYRNINKQVRKEISSKALKSVGLSKRIYHKPSQMSGGQQQRVAIARALAATPAIILADEPTGNLDSESGKEVMKILNAIWKSGKTIILITHDASIAQNASRIVEVQDGKIIQIK